MRLLIATLCCFCVLSATAQTPRKIRIKESVENVGSGSQNALTAVIYISDTKFVERGWIKTLKSMDGKVTNKGGLFADDCSYKRVSKNTFDVWSEIRQDGNDAVKLIAAVDLGGTYMSSTKHGKEYEAMKDKIYTFAVKITKDFIKEQLKDEKKTLKKLEKELDNLKKDNQNLHESIAQFREKIKDAEAAIEQNVLDQEARTTDIAKQEQLILEVEQNLKNVE